MKIRYLFLIVVIAGMFSGCYDEDEIIPTEGNEHIYSLPQGNHDYDQEIVKWFKDYGFYTVYDYNIGDLYWANTNWEEKLEPNLGGRLLAKQADPDYVGQLLELFKELFLNNYMAENESDIKADWLKECMPLKVFLCSEMWDVDWKEGGSSEFGDSTKVWVRSGYDYIAVNGANAEIGSITEADKKEFMRDINKIFMDKLINAGKMMIPDNFLLRTCTYTYKTYTGNEWFPPVNDFISWSTEPFTSSLFRDGYLNIQTVKEGASKEQSQLKDFIYYVDLVMSYSLAELEQETAYWGRSDNGTKGEVLYHGILYPRRGFVKVRQKYEAVVKYIEEDLGINLDRIRFPERFETEEEEVEE